jgi:hypothetical protein
MPDDHENADRFREELAAIEASRTKAQEYLDRTEPKYGWHVGLPRAHWQSADGPLSVAEDGNPVCNDLAVSDTAVGTAYIAAGVMHDRLRCIRPLDHDGPHAATVRARAHGRTKWRAFIWANSNESYEETPGDSGCW